MTLFQQILWGSMYLSTCLFLQIFFLALAEAALTKLRERMGRVLGVAKLTAILVVTLVFIVGSHTVQVWIWAAAYVFSDVLPDWNTSIYFSLVTYTALGYGDIVLAPGVRIFAAFAAVTGLLAFGISTAYLVSLLSRLPNKRDDYRN